MRITVIHIGAFGFGLLLLPAAFAQQNEISVLAGAISPSTNIGVSSAVSISAGTSVSGMIDYARRLKEGRSGDLYFELPAARVAKTSLSVDRDSATVGKSQFYITPGVRYVFVPQSRLAPYVAGGFGFGWFDAGSVTVNVQTDTPFRVTVVHGYKPAFDFGGGAFFRITSRFSLRAEARDFVPVTAGIAHHSLMIAGGFSFRF